MVFNSGVGSNQQYCSHIFKTGATFVANSGMELILSGKGTIDNIVINEITGNWTDTSGLEQGGNDIF